MLEINIPGFGQIKLKHLVSDFTGTLSVDGKLLPGVKGRLNKIAKFLKIHILTADTFGRARAELKGINCTIHILEGRNHDIRKETDFSFKTYQEILEKLLEGKHLIGADVTGACFWEAWDVEKMVQEMDNWQNLPDAEWH